MGIFSDVLAAGVQFPASAPREGQDRVTGQALRNKAAEIDPSAGADFSAANEVQVIPQAESDDGTWTLTINLYDGTTFTTAAMAHDANAAAIEAAIDTASPAAITAGDISVSGGPIDSDDVTLTFDGASVAGQNHGLSTMESTLTLTAAPVEDTTVTVTTTGKPARAAMAALFAMGIVSGTVPAQGVTPTDWVKNDLVKRPRSCVIHDLAREAAREEDNDAIYTVIKALYNLPNSI